ncbi:MAG: heme-dependent oxidative N-demethylase family protein [Rubricella sp.]
MKEVWPWLDRRLIHPPGMLPLGDDPWLTPARPGSVIERARRRIIGSGAPHAIGALPESEGAQRELLDLVVSSVGGTENGQEMPIARAGLMVEDDLLLLDRVEGEHVLVAGVLCFPSQWRLDEKLGRSLLSIHDPVVEYDATLARRVQRLFDALHPDRPLWRMNWLFYPDGAIETPASERDETGKGWQRSGRLFIRRERQALRRLPRSGAIVFSIRTMVTPVEDLPDDALAALLPAVGGIDADIAAYKGLEHAIPRVQAELARRQGEANDGQGSGAV